MSRLTVITGASSGLGSALAARIARGGDTVVLMARRQEQLESVAQAIRDDGGLAHVVTADMSSPDSIRTAFAHVADTWGPVDRLIANAGIGGPTKATDFDGASFERIIQVNLIGVGYCIEAVLPDMIERRSGQIVGIGSLAGYRGLLGSGAYCASKAGLASLLESLRLELRAHGVCVTTICPGFVRTPLTDKNTFKMPFLMELKPAVELMYRAIEQQRSEYAFPWHLAGIVRISRYLPNALYDRLMGKKIRKNSQLPRPLA